MGWLAMKANADGNIVTAETTTMTTGTYTVTENVSISTHITISGDVKLVLGAGTTMTAGQGIEVSQGNTLTTEGSGTLIATGAEIDHSNWTK